jgi:F-type H+-transporting ATPase subunit b
MEETLVALGGLLVRALPTFLIVLVLYFYLRSMFFKPLQRVLDERYAATEGAKEQAARSLERASAKSREYEDAIRAARAEIYQAQEQLHRRLEEQRQQELLAARARADEAVRNARAGLAEEVESARRMLAEDTSALADRIVDSILSRRAA